MASNEALQRHQPDIESQERNGMIERQRLEMEKDLATARRALHRATATAERGAYYGWEDEFHRIQTALAAAMDGIMRGYEQPRPLDTHRT